MRPSGEDKMNFVEPAGLSQDSFMERIRFGTMANLFTGEADPDVALEVWFIRRIPTH